MRSPSYATVLLWLSEIWGAFDENLIRRSFVENDIVGSQQPGELHSALAKTLEGVDVRGYLEDVDEAPKPSDSGSESEGDDDEFSSHTESESDSEYDYDYDSDYTSTSEGSDDEHLARDLDQTLDLNEDDKDEPVIQTPRVRIPVKNRLLTRIQKWKNRFFINKECVDFLFYFLVRFFWLFTLVYAQNTY